MEIKFFKNKEIEEGIGIIDLINRIVLSRSRHEPEYNILNKVIIEKATYA